MSETSKTALHPATQHPESQSAFPGPARHVEPWLRGTLKQIDALRRQVLHALELAGEDLERWCAPLNDAELNTRLFGLPSVAFQIRHISRSLDRLLTYAEDRQLSPGHFANLAAENDPDATHAPLFAELHAALQSASERLHSIDPASYEAIRGVGREHLPSTVGGLLIHCAEHTQRHTGQAITTAKILAAMRAQ